MKNLNQIIIFSTADWDNPFWTNKQHTAKQLSELGHNVLYVESLGLREPSLKSSDLKRIKNRLFKFLKGTKKINNNLWIHSPIVIPFHRFSFIRLLNHWIFKFHIQLVTIKLGFHKPIIWTYTPTIVDLIKSLSHSSIIYHSVDDLSATPGIDSKLILTTESELLKKADYVFCTSRNIERHCKDQAKGSVHYFNNVVDFEHFSKAQSDLEEPLDILSIPHPRIGFIGAISDYKVDFQLIKNVALKKPNWNWVLIGKIGEGQPQTCIEELLDLKNIHILGPKSYNDLPSYIKYFDIASIPCPKNQYTESMFPMKFFEYMAAGKPIIARNIDSLEEYKDSFYQYSTEQEFIDYTNSEFNNSTMNINKNIELAKLNTWEIRLKKMLDIILQQRS